MDLVVIIKLMLSLLGSTAVIVVGISYITYKSKQRANRLAPVKTINPLMDPAPATAREYILHPGNTQAFSNFEMQPALAVATPQTSYMEQVAYAQYRQQEHNRRDRFQVLNSDNVSVSSYTSAFRSEKPFYSPSSRTVVHERPVSKRILNSYADSNEPMYKMNY